MAGRAPRRAVAAALAAALTVLAWPTACSALEYVPNVAAYPAPDAAAVKLRGSRQEASLAASPASIGGSGPRELGADTAAFEGGQGVAEGHDDRDAEGDPNVPLATSVLIFSTFLVCFGIVFEKMQHALLHHVSENTLPIVNALFGELTTLGFIGVFLFVVQKSVNFDDIFKSTFKEGELTENLETVHMVLFLVMLIFLAFVLALVQLSHSLARKWSSYEMLCHNEDELIAHSADRLRDVEGLVDEDHAHHLSFGQRPTAYTPLIGAKGRRDEESVAREARALRPPFWHSLLPCKVFRMSKEAREDAVAREALQFATMRARFIGDVVHSQHAGGTEVAPGDDNEPQSHHGFDFAEYLSILLGHTLAEVVEVQVPTWASLEGVVAAMYAMYIAFPSAVFLWVVVGIAYVPMVFSVLTHRKLEKIASYLTSSTLFKAAALHKMKVAMTASVAAVKFSAAGVRRRRLLGAAAAQAQLDAEAAKADGTGDSKASAASGEDAAGAAGAAAPASGSAAGSGGLGAAAAAFGGAGAGGSGSGGKMRLAREVSLKETSDMGTGADTGAGAAAGAAAEADADAGAGAAARPAAVPSRPGVRFDASVNGGEEDLSSPPRAGTTVVPDAVPDSPITPSLAAQHGQLLPPFVDLPLRQRSGFWSCVLGRPPTKQESLFWMDRHGPHFLLHIIRTTMLFEAMYIAVSIMFFVNGDYACSDHAPAGRCVIMIAGTALPVVFTVSYIPAIIANFVIVTSIEMMHKRKVVDKVVRAMRTRRAMRALKMISAMKVHAKKLGGAGPGGSLSRPKSAADVYGDASSARRRQRERELREVFKLFDKDNKGSVTAKDLTIMLDMVGIEDSKETADAIMGEIDVDGGGDITFDEFVNWMAAQDAGDDELSEEELYRQIFELIDRDGSGEVDAEELKNVLAALGEGMSDDDVMAIVREADADGNGSIDCKEFAAMLARHTKHKEYGL